MERFSEKDMAELLWCHGERLEKCLAEWANDEPLDDDDLWLMDLIGLTEEICGDPFLNDRGKALLEYFQRVKLEREKED